MYRSIAALVFIAACSKGAPARAPSSELNAKQVPAERPTAVGEAWVVADDGLHTYGVDGLGPMIAPVTGVVESCGVDTNHGGIWLVGGGAIRAYDLEAKKLVEVATGVPEEAVWRVGVSENKGEYFRQSAGNADGMHECSALSVLVGQAKIRGALIAEGDFEYSCGEHKGPEARLAPNPEVTKRIEAYDRARLTNAGFLNSLSKRKTRWAAASSKGTAPAKPTPAVERAKCEEEPAACGTVEYLGGGRIWSVVTSNSRGDFFHQDTQLFDSRDSQFWNPSTGEKQSSPFAEGTEESYNVAPSGRWALWSGKVLSLDNANVEGPLDYSFCGWVVMRSSP